MLYKMIREGLAGKVILKQRPELGRGEFSAEETSAKALRQKDLCLLGAQQGGQHGLSEWSEQSGWK